ncbi:MAG: chemotaxis protein CheD [Acidobacteriota bacterium]
MAEENVPQIQEYFLKPGYIYVPTTPARISTVLGSCVSVCLWDRDQGYGGMNHFLYPLTRDPASATARFGNVATRALIGFFLEGGSKAKHLEAQIFGGAHPSECAPEVARVSRENVDVARRVLDRNKIRIVSEDTGGSRGRKLVYNSFSNEVVIIRVEALRQGDWYPYEGGR